MAAPGEAVEMVKDIIHYVSVLERCRSMLRPIGSIHELVKEIGKMDPDLAPELLALDTALSAALEAAVAVMRVGTAKFAVKYGVDFDAGV